jgi:hypothetical protein
MKPNRLVILFISLCLPYLTIADSIDLREKHPETYTVKKGDTLWGISQMFLKDPWLWPHVWEVNKQVNNPHLIYPGDILKLIWINGEPKIVSKKLKKLSPTPRLSEKGQPIPIVPLSFISAFLSKDHVIDSTLVEGAPRLLGDALGTPRFFEGDLFYGEGQFDKHKIYGIYRKAKKYHDPKTGEFLGQELTFIGQAVVSRNKDVKSTKKVTPFDLVKSLLSS